MPIKSGKAVLLDAADFRDVRSLGLNALAWSPDSRFLLGWRPRARDLRCGLYTGTLEMVEAASGRIATVRNSKCKYSGGIMFWVNNNVVAMN